MENSTETDNAFTLSSSLKRWTETFSNEVELKEAEPDAIATIIRFLYGFNYVSSSGGSTRTFPILFDAQIYGLADRYGIPSLKKHVKDKFSKSIRACWDMDDFPLVIEEVYSSTPAAVRDLRDLVAGISYEFRSKLLVKEEFIRVLESCSCFAADLVRLGASSESMAKYRCPVCGKRWGCDANVRFCVLCGKPYSGWSLFVVK
ncbi:hypothetical protein MauCBS54593_003742 [Microsporum audouinii]